jgi:hypothetical protein
MEVGLGYMLHNISVVVPYSKTNSVYASFAFTTATNSTELLVTFSWEHEIINGGSPIN